MEPSASFPSRRTFLTIAAASVATVAATGAAAPARAGGPPAPVPVPQNSFTPVVVSPLAPVAPTVLATDGRYHAMYELQLINAKAAPATLQKLEIVDAAHPSRVIATYDQAGILGQLRTTFPRPAADTVVPEGSTRFLFVELVFDSRAAVPAQVAHRFTMLAASNPGATVGTALTYTVAPLALPQRPVLTLAPPLRGPGWIDVNGGFSAGITHRGSIQTVNGGFFDAQRYAIDYLRMDAAGHVVNGDPNDVHNYVNYGAAVYAAAAGTVVAVLDELPDQPPGKLPDPASITLDTVDGNHVVLDIGGGLFAFYAHLQKGSVLVRRGARVSSGQQLGKLGNSGNTSAPHLHFHIMDGPSVLGSDGRPYVIDSFATTGLVSPTITEVDDLSGNWGAGRTAPVGHRGMFPDDLQIIDFPGM